MRNVLIHIEISDLRLQIQAQFEMWFRSLPNLIEEKWRNSSDLRFSWNFLRNVYIEISDFSFQKHLNDTFHIISTFEKLAKHLILSEFCDFSLQI